MEDRSGTDAQPVLLAKVIIHRMPQVDLEGAGIPNGARKSILRGVPFAGSSKETMAEKHQEILDLLDRNELDKAKPTPKQDLYKDGGGGRSSKRDLRALIKTAWAINGKLDDLIGVMTAVLEKLEDLINLQ